MELHVATLTPETWSRYQAMLGRNIPVPKQVVLVQSAEHLVGGLCLYPTDGPYTVVMDVVFRPELSKPECEEVVTFMLSVTLGVCAVQAKAPMLVGTPEMSAMMEAVGFTKHPLALYVATPGQPPPKKVTPKKKPIVAVAAKKKKKASKKKKTRKKLNLFED